MSNACTRRQALAAGAAAAAATLPRRATNALLGAGVASPAEPAIWDAHGHLTAAGTTVEQRVDCLLSYADRVGIDRLIVSMGTRFVADPNPAELRRQNDDVLRACAHSPRILGLAYLNPNHPTESLAEIERCVARGPMVGVKLWIARRCHEPALDPLVARAAELNAIVLQHAYWRTVPTLPGESLPPDVAALAARHPTASIICGHTGNDWERGLRAIRPAGNVFADISGCDPTAGMVEMAVRELGAERVLYGSDFGGRSYASQLAKVVGARISAAEKQLILGDNIRRLLGPILRSKG